MILDLENPETLPATLNGIDRIFMVTGYTAAMLYQSKRLIDFAVAAGVSFVVHLGVYSSGKDQIPRFCWHDMVETYIKASKLAWTNLHPNLILDSILVTEPSTTEQRAFNVFWGDAASGWVSAADIGSVAAAVLREGLEEHAGADYSLSPEVLTSTQAAAIITKATGLDIKCNILSSDILAANIAQVPDAVFTSKALCRRSVSERLGKCTAKPLYVTTSGQSWVGPQRHCTIGHVRIYPLIHDKTISIVRECETFGLSSVSRVETGNGLGRRE